MEQGNHAIVFGASGIIGWSIIDQLLSPPYYSPGPDKQNNDGSFARVTAVTNRPIPLADSQWPGTSTTADDGDVSKTSDKHVPSLQLASGVDLSRGTAEELAQDLREKIVDADKISHVYYCVFTSFSEDQVKEVEINLGMMRRVIDAMSLLTKSLKFVVFPGGTRGYGIYIPGGTFKPPLEEYMADNLPLDYAKTVVYPRFRELLTEKSRGGQDWDWCEVCPDAIIGFTPNGSQFSLALHWAQYLSLYAAKNSSSSSEIPFPGNRAAYNARFTPVSARTIARFAIYYSLSSSSSSSTPANKSKNDPRLFNIADSPSPTTFSTLWPKLAAHFGLVGVGPDEEDGDQMMPGEYVSAYGAEYDLKGGVKGEDGRKQLDSVGKWLTFDRDLSLERTRNVGRYMEERDPVEGWLDAFVGFGRAGLLVKT